MLRRTSGRKKRIIRGLTVILASMLMSCLLAAGCMAAPEEQRMPALESGRKGTLKVTMKYTDPNTETVKNMPGVEVKLAQVASVENEGGFAEYTLLEPYKGSGIKLSPMTASESNEAAAILAPLAEGNTVKTAVSDSNGMVTFDHLDPGMYLVFQSEGANASYLVDAISTFLVQVPYPKVQAGGNEWQYQVEAYPKTELVGAYSNGLIRVKKQLFNLEDGLSFYPPQNQELVFYVGLFTDAACTSRAVGTVDMPLRFWNSDTAEAVFENLAIDKTYYIAETDGKGNVIENVLLEDDTIFAANYPEGQSVSITPQKPEGEITFQNVTAKLPMNYYYGGTLTVTKKTVKNGQSYNTDQVFYAALFTDPAFRNRYSAVIELNMNGSSSVSVPVEVSVGNAAGSSVTYYVTETDENGKALGNSSQEFTFTLDKPGGKVTMSTSSPNADIVITNDFTTENTTEGGDGSSVSGGGSSGPRTGDDTPVAGYILLMIAALAVLLLSGGLAVRRHRSK